MGIKYRIIGAADVKLSKEINTKVDQVQHVTIHIHTRIHTWLSCQDSKLLWAGLI